MRLQFPKQWSPEQLTILRSAPRPIEIIKGAAGSGKTLTALLKMAFAINYFAREQRPLRVQVLSYNRTLRGYIMALLSHQGFPAYNSNQISVEIDTFAKWAKAICNEEYLSITAPHKYLQSIPSAHPLAPRYEDSFIAEEMEYILKRFPHDNLNSYINARRKGRGSTPAINQQDRKIIIDEYIRPYGNWKLHKGFKDWNDLAWQASEIVSPSYDIIVVDEGQDFTANQYRVIMKSLLQNSCFICVVDTVQNIYLNGFTWAECGIDAVHNQPHTLSYNFRNTKEIALLSASLLGGMSIDDDGVMPIIHDDMRSGPVPILLEGKFSKQFSYIIQKIKDAEKKQESSAILIKAENWFSEAETQLAAAGISYDRIVREAEWPDTDVYVVLSTMHSAKGLEFDHVFMPGINSQLFPLYSVEAQEAAERDRRLLAMAVGRARETVIIGQKPGEVCPYFDSIPNHILCRISV